MGRLTAILLGLTAFSTPWFTNNNSDAEIPLPAKAKDERKDEDFILKDKVQAWYQIPHVCTILLMYLYSQEFEGNCKVYCAVYPLILPVLVQFLAGDVRYFVEARIYALYSMFMIAALQRPKDSESDNSDKIVPIDDLHKCLYDCEYPWVCKIRRSNEWAWALLAVATVLCCLAWYKMKLKKTFLGRAVTCITCELPAV